MIRCFTRGGTKEQCMKKRRCYVELKWLAWSRELQIFDIRLRRGRIDILKYEPENSVIRKVGDTCQESSILFQVTQYWFLSLADRIQ